MRRSSPRETGERLRAIRGVAGSLRIPGPAGSWCAKAPGPRALFASELPREFAARSLSARLSPPWNSFVIRRLCFASLAPCFQFATLFRISAQRCAPVCDAAKVETADRRHRRAAGNRSGAGGAAPGSRLRCGLDDGKRRTHHDANRILGDAREMLREKTAIAELGSVIRPFDTQGPARR